VTNKGGTAGINPSLDRADFLFSFYASGWRPK